MADKFDWDEAKKFLQEKEAKDKQQKENERIALLQKVISILKDEFNGTGVEVYLIGSILQPFRFTKRSDVDIVLKNFKGDLFDLWSPLEHKIDWQIEIIIFEKSRLQEFVLKEGLRVI